MLWVPVGTYGCISIPAVRDAEGSHTAPPTPLRLWESEIWVTPGSDNVSGTGESWEDPGPVGVPGALGGSGFTRHSAPITAGLPRG